mmetsp:Transcript_33675/g.66704  ORF Transcript_33675/g.66704 Transcript_33675/m.66704 type:complete len:250 (-) Transcript_33675:312-1061(-)
MRVHARQRLCSMCVPCPPDLSLGPDTAPSLGLLETAPPFSMSSISSRQPRLFVFSSSKVPRKSRRISLCLRLHLTTLSFWSTRSLLPQQNTHESFRMNPLSFRLPPSASSPVAPGGPSEDPLAFPFSPPTSAMSLCATGPRAPAITRDTEGWKNEEVEEEAAPPPFSCAPSSASMSVSTGGFTFSAVLLTIDTVELFPAWRDASRSAQRDGREARPPSPERLDDQGEGGRQEGSNTNGFTTGGGIARAW